MKTFVNIVSIIVLVLAGFYLLTSTDEISNFGKGMSLLVAYIALGVTTIWHKGE